MKLRLLEVSAPQVRPLILPPLDVRSLMARPMMLWLMKTRSPKTLGSLILKPLVVLSLMVLPMRLWLVGMRSPKVPALTLGPLVVR
jgi:hypothetical protein